MENFSKDRTISLWFGNYKARLRASDLKKWSSKSFRLIVHLIEEDWILIPISIYLNSDKENLSKNEIEKGLKDALSELNNS